MQGRMDLLETDPFVSALSARESGDYGMADRPVAHSFQTTMYPESGLVSRHYLSPASPPTVSRVGGSIAPCFLTGTTNARIHASVVDRVSSKKSNDPLDPAGNNRQDVQARVALREVA